MNKASSGPPGSNAGTGDSLAQRIIARTRYLGDGLIQAGGFLNHRIDSQLMTEIGEGFAQRFARAGIEGISLVVTAETSGIAPALVTAQAIGVPMLFARKQRPSTMAGECYAVTVPSHTKGKMVELSIAAEYLSSADRVVLIDDFLGSGLTARGMLQLLAQSGCRVCGLGFVLEKVYERGREAIAGLGIPVISLVRLDIEEQQLVLRAAD
ncbi:MAG: xanthine phosphoribosyltransferase [Gammaproteobacteria bacterium]|nr:MAG: xanthine phosphoribosyltransferase [Gammaproteobacteria bacterium]